MIVRDHQGCWHCEACGGSWNDGQVNVLVSVPPALNIDGKEGMPLFELEGRLAHATGNLQARAYALDAEDSLVRLPELLEAVQSVLGREHVIVRTMEAMQLDYWLDKASAGNDGTIPGHASPEEAVLTMLSRVRELITSFQRTSAPLAHVHLFDDYTALLRLATRFLPSAHVADPGVLEGLMLVAKECSALVRWGPPRPDAMDAVHEWAAWVPKDSACLDLSRTRED